MMPKQNPEKITPDNPEATNGWFAKAKPASAVLPELFGAAASEMLMPKRRGRPVLEKTKTPVNIRLDPDIVNAFKESGAGWQTKINDALKDWLKNNPIATRN
ncbi:MAG: BrnA antitoxin family protein [Methylococcales bacterium]|nr:BrnA antitoxin family protein [Methylococcales bacterium]